MSKKIDKRGCKGGDDCREDNHLCKMAKRHELDSIREAVKGSKYLCLKCGRTAVEPSYLCRPDII